MSLIFATQLTAVATAALAVFAVVMAAFAFLAYRKQTQDVGILIDQNREHQQTLEREAREWAPRRPWLSRRAASRLSIRPAMFSQRSVQPVDDPLIELQILAGK